MKSWYKVAALTLLLAVFAFLAGPMGPLGGFWPPAADLAEPQGAQVPLLMFLTAVEDITFGLGVSFLLFGYPLVRAVAPASPALTRAAYVAIFWLLATWWPHDSLHIHNGMDLNGLIVIDYVFHMTLIIAGLVVAWFFYTITRRTADGVS